MIELRDYQHECLVAIWRALYEEKRALAVMPTASGKTEVFKALCEQFDGRVLILVNKIKLVKQTAKRVGDSCGVFCASLKRKEIFNKIVVASVQSLRGIDLNDFDLIIIDEVHNVDEKAGRFFQILDKLKDKKIAGFTATPFRNDGYIYGAERLFSKVTYSKTVKEMIENNYLVKPILRGSDVQFDTSKLSIKMGEYDSKSIDDLVKSESKAILQVNDALSKLEGRKKIVWSCANIEHAQMISTILKTKEETATSVHSKQSLLEQEQAISSFENGTTRHMTFVTIVSEGYDYPPIDAVVLMRPTRSPRLYIQTVGRGLRLAENKKDCLILDYGRVVAELGPIDNPKVIKQVGKLTKEERSKNEMKFCPACFTYMPIQCSYCEFCKHEFAPKDPLKNLTKKSDESSSILSPKEEKIFFEKIKDFRVNFDHVSKNGNKCIKITYIPEDIFADSINEYFMQNVYWAQINYKKRVEKLNSLKDGFVKELILSYKKDKYIKVVDLKYV